MGNPGDGSFRHTGQHPPAPFSDSFPVALGDRDGCLTVPVASGSSIRLPATENTSSSPQAGKASRRKRHPRGTKVASATLVSRHSSSGRRRGHSASSETRPLDSGSSLPSSSGAVPLNSVEIERSALAKRGYSDQVIDTLLASRKPSTAKVYNNTWKRFRSWCLGRGLSPLRFRTSNLLQFLQEGMNKGLSPSTLRRQISALRSTLGDLSVRKALTDPDVSRFLKGVTQQRPPPVHHFPSWDLPLVLAYVSEAPFEPLFSSDLESLTRKTLFLVAATSARRVSELGALSVNPSLCLFHSDKVVLRPDPAFIPKVNSWFHRAQELAIPSFCPRPKTQVEVGWHKLDARRAVKHYIERTKPFRKTDCLFVLFRGPSKGKRPSRSTLSKWLKGTIASAYLSSGRVPPAGITAHSIRSAATSAAFEGVTSIESICRAATWASPNTFIKHYKIDVAASADAAFGRRVLQKIVTT